MPKLGHGLTFVQGDNILTSKAKLTKGTFTDYLDSLKIEWNSESEISLGDALGFIIEIGGEYSTYSPLNSHFERVLVSCVNGGEAKLNFNSYGENFESEWELAFPQLADCCTYHSDKFLLVNNLEIGKNYNDITNFIGEKLQPWLTLIDAPIWFAFPQNKDVLSLNRISYYYVAMFILGSAVRYQPELILPANAPDSELGWILKKFISSAERFFPQLKLMEIHRLELYY